MTKANAPFIICLSIWFLAQFPLWQSGHTAGIASGPASMEIFLLFFIPLLVSQFALFAFAYYMRHSDYSWDRWVFILSCILCVAAALGSPWLDDDLFRYMWDGYVNSLNLPILDHAPTSQVRAGFPPHIYQLISYKEIPTVYPPFAQLWFHVLWSTFGQNILGWTGAFAVITCLFLWVMYVLLRQRKTPLWLRICLLGSPLLIKEFADSAHLDILGYTLIAICWILCQSSFMHKRNKLTILLAGVLVGTAGLIKITPLILLAVLPIQSVKTKLSIGVIALSLFVVGLFGYFGSVSQVSYYFEVLNYFNANWVFYPSLYNTMTWVGDVIFNIEDPHGFTMLGLRGVSVAMLIWAGVKSLTNQLRLEAGFFMIMGFIVVSPVVNLWYVFLLWPLAANLNTDDLAKCFGAPVLILTITTFFSYTFWINLEPIYSINLMMWSLFAGSLCYCIYVGKITSRSKT